MRIPSWLGEAAQGALHAAICVALAAPWIQWVLCKISALTSCIGPVGYDCGSAWWRIVLASIAIIAIQPLWVKSK